jgi:photosystem II stability/assembly factor-like uncharacterized protein
VNCTLRARLFFTLLALGLSGRAASADPIADDFAGLKYRSIGPAISGGRTTAVAGSDVDPAVYYAGGADGGVFRSSDGGMSWKPVFDRASTAAIGAIAVAPKDANDVWVGTGESNPRNDVQEGAGVWHSRDGGKSWMQLGLDDAGSISSIALDPRDPKTVVVGVLGHVFRDGSVRGVYVTHDAGAHWTRTLFVGPSSGVSQVVRVPDRPNTLFAGIWEFRRRPWMMTSGGVLGGLYRSDDGGATWRKQIGHGFPTGPTGRIGIAAASSGRIYAIVQSREGDLFRSDDGGSTWTRAPHSPYIGARPFYFSNIYVDPADRERLIAVALILSMSKNGATSFDRIATNGGWDYHASWWSADGRRLIVGSDEGVVISADGGKHWWQPYDLPFSQPYHVAFDDAVPTYDVCVGLQDNNSWCAPNSAPNTVGVLNRDWYTVGPGDGMHAIFDPQDHDLIWQTSTNTGTGQIYLYDARTTQTLDVSPVAADNNDRPADLAHRFNWDTPIAFTQDGTALVGGEVVFASADKGRTWTVMSPDLTRNDRSHQQISGGPISVDVSGAETSDTLLSIAPSRLDAGVIWTGSDDGLVHVTRDGGKTWSDATPPGAPHFGRAYTVEPSGVSAGSAYVAFDAHMVGDDRPYLFATADYGKTWSSLGDGFPRSDFVRVVREDPKNANILYAGTKNGVEVSFDRGRRWHDLRLNMPATAIYDLQIQPDANDLIVASHGRGVFILDDLEPVQAFATLAPSTPTLFAPHAAYRLWQAAPVNTFTDQTLPDGEFVGDDRIPAVFSYYLPKAARHVEVDVIDGDKRIVKHLAGSKITGHAGINRTGWDLTEDGPVRWRSTFEQNRGPKSGAEVIPGTYVVRLIADDRTIESTLTVIGDPRDPATAKDAPLRHDALAALNAEMSGIDTWLNEIDDKRKTTRSPDAFAAFRGKLTMDPQNVEDLRAPPQLRERVEDLLSRIASSSFQAPTATQTTELARLQTMYASLASEAHREGL